MYVLVCLRYLLKFLWTPLLMEAAFAATPRHDRLTFPIPRLHWGMVKLGTESGKVTIKIARRARAGQTLPLLQWFEGCAVLTRRRKCCT